MTENYTATIYTQVYDLLLWLLPLTQKFPKDQRFVLAKRLQDTALELHELLVQARRVKPLDQRRAVLTDADLKLEQLRLYLRLSHDLKLVSPAQYEQGARRTDEVGRLLGSQIKRAGAQT